ncbi:hypothetical protein GUITHDRAFT_151605 [Guillardia theta CCMP2712]|uniref:Uncharacterized protein n=1 Tax=Guillardia theta (strain CCMP2712) TaxID=905079 RepID=L1JL49_GUITC|nr:hypothetical protein GUITHDRAFT_151605 [Guillardia theta CCMP2712]EKX49072.1 hypothetical protein GUITHDRAFT_151605 [Guillardia theta CCMP2712]|eukprot:XP_005836052.1 hypothetical protein GUITHDRAFT_151605 [Guillardia theta CCMP2712]
MEQARQFDILSKLYSYIQIAVSDDVGMSSRLIHLDPDDSYQTFRAQVCSRKASELIYEQQMRSD